MLTPLPLLPLETHRAHPQPDHPENKHPSLPGTPGLSCYLCLKTAASLPEPGTCGVGSEKHRCEQTQRSRRIPSIYFCTEHELPTSPFLFIRINSNHTTIHQLILQPSYSSLGPAPPKAQAHLFPRMLGVGDTQQDAAHTPSLWSCRGIPTETARPRLALPHRTSIPHTHPGIKGHDCHDHSPSFLPLHRWA